MRKVIGTITTCNSDEHRYLRGYQVRIIAVIKGAAAPDLDPEADLDIATTDEELARQGGLETTDRVDVQPFLETEGRFSFAASDVRVTDLVGWEQLIGTK